MDDSSQTGLALYDGEGDTHLAAESRQEDDELNGVDIVGDQDQGGLLVLNQANNVVQTVLDGVGLLGDILLLLALLDGGGLLQQTLLLLDLGLRAVLVEELESLGGGVLVEDLLELGDRRGNLQPHVEDLLLALEADIFGPLHHARKVALGLDVGTDAEVARTLLDERVLMAYVSPPCSSAARHGSVSICRTYLGGLLASLRLGEGGGSRLLSGFGRLSLRKKDISECVPLLGGLSRSLKSSHEASLPSCGGSSQVITRVRRQQAEAASRISSRAVESHRPTTETSTHEAAWSVVTKTSQSSAYHFEGWWSAVLELTLSKNCGLAMVQRKGNFSLVGSRRKSSGRF